MADKPSKPQKLKARLPRGLADPGPAEITATRHMVEAIRVVFERYRFEPVETPAIEYTDTMEALGIPRGSYLVKVNNRKILDGAMAALQIPAEKHLTTMRAIDKLDRLGIDGVRMLLGKGRKDESGDFTKGADLTDPQIAGVVAAITGKGDASNTMPTIAGEQELAEIAALVNAAGYDDRVRIDKTVVRGLEYYTGPVYEVELTFEIKDEKGRPVRFGSVGGGGRYDGLVFPFRGEPVPATGFSIGVSRLQVALAALGKLGGKPAAGPVVVTAFDLDRIADYQRMVSALRAANIRAELYLGNPKNNIGTQLKYADKRGSPCAIIQGGDEKTRGEVQIKDLILGAALANTKDREEYLKKQAEAQFAVKENALVEAGRTLLARHGLA